MISTLLSGIVAKLAALGLPAKAAIALTTATVTVGGVAATDLPEAVSDSLNGTEQHAPAEEGETPQDAEFGTSVSEDATDEDEPGVVGSDVADEARQRAAERAEAADDAATQGLDRARENTAGTPAQIPAETGPAAADGRRPSDTPQGPPEGTPQGAPEGTPDGGPEGTPDGAPEGTPDGAPEGTPDGAPEGTPQGQPDGAGAARP